MKVNEIFESIQGEGKYAGTPALFIRLSGCTRNCSFCDTKYHNEYKNMGILDIVNEIKKSKTDTVIWTGGEPLLQINEIRQVIKELEKNKKIYRKHHLETNGDLILNQTNELDYIVYLFDYICISPKLKDIFKYIKNTFFTQPDYTFDIKVVTDLKVNKELIKYATMLMPLTVNNSKKDSNIRKKVWQYCVKHNLKYSPRLHYEVWGKKKGI